MSLRDTATQMSSIQKNDRRKNFCEENQFHLKTFPSSEDQSQRHLTQGLKIKETTVN